VDTLDPLIWYPLISEGEKGERTRGKGSERRGDCSKWGTGVVVARIKFLARKTFYPPSPQGQGGQEYGESGPRLGYASHMLSEAGWGG